MVDITKNGVNFAALKGQLLSGDIDRPAFLGRNAGLAAISVSPIFTKRASFPSGVQL